VLLLVQVSVGLEGHNLIVEVPDSLKRLRV